MLEEIIKESRQWLTLVSPYHDHWLRLRDEVDRARKRGVSIRIYYRTDAEGGDPAAKYQESIESIPVDHLHAKVYANENVALVSSMNLSQFSVLNSWEAGLLIREGKVLRQVEDWISTLPQSDKDTATTVYASELESASTLLQGYCIACESTQSRIALNPQRPFCSSAGHVFAFATGLRCHKCGKSGRTSRKVSLCKDCTKDMRSSYCIACEDEATLIKFNLKLPFCTFGIHDFNSAVGLRCHYCAKSAKTSRNKSICQQCIASMNYGYCIACEDEPNIVEFNPLRPFCSFGIHDFNTAVGVRCHRCGESFNTSRQAPMCPAHN